MHMLRSQYEITSQLAEKLVALASKLLDFSRPFLDLEEADEQDRIFIHRGFEEHTVGRHCITPQIWVCINNLCLFPLTFSLNARLGTKLRISMSSCAYIYECFHVPGHFVCQVVVNSARKLIQTSKGLFFILLSVQPPFQEKSSIVGYELNRQQVLLSQIEPAALVNPPDIFCKIYTVHTYIQTLYVQEASIKLHINGKRQHTYSARIF